MLSVNMSLRDALLLNPLIEECVVTSRKADSGEISVVAYIVSAHPISLRKLEAELKASLPEEVLPSAYVLVSALPLTETGDLDEVALARLPVIDAELVRRVEEQLQQNPEVEDVAVVIEHRIPKPPPLHLDDLLPDTQEAFSEAPPPEIAGSTVQEWDEGARALKKNKPAICYGPSLQYPEDAPQTLQEVLQRAAQQSPTGIIYIQSDGSDQFQSYRDLWDEARRILTGLRKLGLKPQDKVIFQLADNQDFVSAFWGCVLGGFIPVPLSVVIPYGNAGSSVSKLQNVWRMLGKPLVLTSPCLAPELSNLAQALHLETFQVATIDQLRHCQPALNWYRSQPEDLAILLLTSGSTGTPKAVMQNHRSLIARCAGTTLTNGFTQADVSLNWLSLVHVGAIIMFHVRDVFLGCQQIHVPTELILQAPTKWLDWISDYRATITWAPNFAYGLVNDELERLTPQSTPPWDLSSMRFILNGGEAIVGKTARRFLQLLQPYQLPPTAMHPAWGMSETCSGVVFSHSFSLNSDKDEQKFVEVGSPIHGFAIRIVDENNQVVEEETIGRLQVKGASVTSGYYENAKANEDAFTEDGWFNTGDLGLIQSGCLTITGRHKDIIIVNGVNHYCNEIEAIVEEVLGVERSYTAACAVRADDSNTDKLALFFNSHISCPEALAKLLAKIRTHVVQNLEINPDYLIPVDQSVIPKTDIGKIQRPQLVQRFQTGEFQSILKQVDVLSGNRYTIPDWFYRQTWCPKNLKRWNRLSELDRPILVFLDAWGLGRRVCDLLTQRGLFHIKVVAGEKCSRIDDFHYEICPGKIEHYQWLLQDLIANEIIIGDVLHLWTYGRYTGEVRSAEELEQSQTLGLYSLLFLVQSLAKVQESIHRVRLAFVSSYTHAITPDDCIAYEKAAVLGILRTIPQELPWLDCRHIDLNWGSPDQDGDHLLQELQNDSKEPEVAYREGQRFVLHLEQADLLHQPAQPIPFQVGGTYLISGGLGGVGFIIARYLLKTYRARLLLVGRTPLPERATWSSYLSREDQTSQRIKAYQELETLGGSVRYEAVDICDAVKLQQTLDQWLAEWEKPLDGVIHLAGVYSEKLLLEETPESLWTVLRSKVLGGWTLHQLVRENAGSLFISFSSVNSFLGGVAVGAYAAANSFIDGLSHYQRCHSSLQSYCFAWSMWDEIGMSQGYPMKSLTLSRGFQVMSTAQTLSSMLAGLCRVPDHLLIGLDGSNPNIRRWQTEPVVMQALTAYFTARSSDLLLPSLKVFDRYGVVASCNLVQVSEISLDKTGWVDETQQAYIAPRTATEQQVAEIWSRLLRLQEVGIHDNFFVLGGNSLLATQLVSRLREAFRIEIPIRTIFEAQTVEKLSDRIEMIQWVSEQNQNSDNSTADVYKAGRL
jgi:acyl-CoA synthetase (AMP-forming)/AMP-acid ligase II/NAD(P)-dependent dehydrogenase (short-subunit alcohol dehydrogenase family)/acyl carrier protein